MSTAALPDGIFRLTLEQHVVGTADGGHKGAFDTTMKMDMSASKLLHELEDGFEALIAANNNRTTCIFCEANIADSDHYADCYLITSLTNLLREAKR